MTHPMYATTTSQSKGRIRARDSGFGIRDSSSQKHAAEPPEGDDDRGLQKDHLHVPTRHSAALRSASIRSAFASASVAFDHHDSSASSCWRDAFAARAV